VTFREPLGRHTIARTRNLQKRFQDPKGSPGVERLGGVILSLVGARAFLVSLAVMGCDVEQQRLRSELADSLQKPSAQLLLDFFIVNHDHPDVRA